MAEIERPRRLVITLTDSGMFDRTLEAASWEEIPALLARDETHNYTFASISEGSKVIGWAQRALGETEWRTGRRHV